MKPAPEQAGARRGKPRSAAVLIREATDGDGEQVIRLIGSVFAEFPGCVLDVDGELPHLRVLATRFAEWDGRFWVAEAAGRVVACGGFAGNGDSIELKHIYVDAACRRQGLAGRLCDLAEEEARRRGCARIELWTDSRFTDAHRLYESRGYVRSPLPRHLDDLSASVEYRYSKELL